MLSQKMSQKNEPVGLKFKNMKSRRSLWNHTFVAKLFLKKQKNNKHKIQKNISFGRKLWRKVAFEGISSSHFLKGCVGVHDLFLASFKLYISVHMLLFCMRFHSF